MDSIEIHPLKFKDLSDSEKIYLPENLIEQFANKIGKKLYTSIMLADGSKFAVEVGNSRDEFVRIGFTLRTLLNCPKGEKISLHKPELKELTHLDDGFSLGLFKRTWRHLDSWQESALESVLGAPTSTFRTSMAYPGDDDRFLVRIHPSLFPRLGIRPGDHVFIERLGRKIVVVAFEEHLEDEFKSSAHLKRNQAEGLETKDLPEDFPMYLIIRVSPRARNALGIPRNDVASIVRVIRRIRTQIVSEFNKMILPIALLVIGILPTGLSLLWKLGLILAIVPLIIGVALAPLKIRQTPKGFWP